MNLQNRSKLTQILVIDEFFDNRANNFLELPEFDTHCHNARDNLRNIIFAALLETRQNSINLHLLKKIASEIFASSVYWMSTYGVGPGSKS